MGLSEFYQSLEDKYYNFMDGLEASGVKVYEWFINPIEDRGMPSMPVFIIGTLLLLGLGAFAIMTALGGGLPGGAQAVSVAVKVTGPDGANLDGVLVKLSAGEEVFSVKTKNGVANFADVPYTTSVTVRIDESGFKSFSKEFNLASGRSSATFSISLEAAGGAGGSIVLFVNDDNQLPLSNAEVRFQDPLTGEFVVRQTDAQGRVVLSVPSSADVMNLAVSHDGYESTTQSCVTSTSSCSVTLYSSGDYNPEVPGSTATPNPSTNPRFATVRVEILDNQGNGLSGRVTLYRNDDAETLDAADTDGEGVVRFDNVPIGIDVYATFDPEGNDFSFHTFDAKITTAATDFFVQLPKKTCAFNCGTDFSQITIQAVDSANNPLAGAQVRLYLSQAALQAVSDIRLTEDDGNAVFDIAPTARVYGTVWAEGYLPQMTRVMTGGEKTQVKLEKVLVGNHGSLNVTVVDDTGAVASGASVNLFTHDGFPVGLSSQDTGIDGVTVFENLPLKRVKATAVFGAQVGSSDIVEISLAQKGVRVTLQPATAFVSARATDASNGSSVNATFTAVLSSSSRVVGTCVSNGTACSIQVPANRNLVFFANASGFVSLTSEEFSVDAGATKQKVMALLPSHLSNQLLVQSYSVEDEYGWNVTSLDRGRVYRFVVQFNLPSNAQSAGVFLRVGNQPDAAKSIATFGDYAQPAGVQVTKGGRFNAGPSCADDLGDQNGPIQWIDWNYGSTFGSNTVSAEVFVKPDAKPKDEVVLQYRIYAKAGDVYIRKPEDARFSGQEKTADLDSCYAQTITVKLPVVDGKSDCNERACISTLFLSNNSAAVNGLRVDAGEDFDVLLDIRSFESLDSPQLVLTSSNAVKIIGYDFGGTLTPVNPPSSSVSIPLSFYQHAYGTIHAKALLPTASSKFNFRFEDTSGAILDVPRFVVVQGTGTFQIATIPASIEALQDNDLTVRVLSDRGIPVTDAHLTLKETVSSPFDGFPNDAPFLNGDDSKDNGKDGTYKFKRLRPVTPGKFAVVVSRNGFEEAEAVVAVNATEPLEFGQDLSNIELDCKNPTALTVSSRVGAELKVAASFSGTACANLRVVSASSSTGATGSGSTSANFRVKPGKDTRVMLTPTENGECFLAFNAETLNGLALGEPQIAVLSAQCENLISSPTPGVSVSPVPGNASPSPTPVPGADCAARGGQCVALGQSCPSGFVPSTYQQSNPTWPTGYTPYSNVPGYNPYGAQGGIGGPIGQQSCQQLGGSCTFSQTGVCPTGQSQLGGAGTCGIAESGSMLCCGTPRATVPTSTAVCTEGSQCCVPVSQVCQAPNFNFQNILSKYLGYYLGAQTLGNYPQQVTAASAPTQLVASQSGGSLKKAGSGCTQSGSGVSCTKPIYSLVPYNAMAFSVENQLFNAVDIQAQSNSRCFEYQDVGKFSGVNEIFSDLKQNLQSSMGLLTRQTRTFVITFRPRPECVQYEIDANGRASVKLVGDAVKGFQMKLKPFGTGVNIDARDYIIKFDVAPATADDDAASHLAFIAMPTGGVTLRGDEKASFEEPAVFANNIQVKQNTVFVSGLGLNNLPVTGTKAVAATLKLAKGDNKLSLQLGASAKGTASITIPTTVKTATDGLKAYDVVGNVGTAPAPFECSGANYCNKEQAEAYLESVKKSLNDFARQYVSSVDTLAYEDPLGLNGGEGSAYQTLYQQAMRDALREYMALRQPYEACKAQGQDPLSGTRQQCQQSGIAPIYNYNQNQPGYYNQQGFGSGYNPYGGAYGGQGGSYGGGANINPALGGGQVPGMGNPYQSNFYPGQGYYPGYVNDPNIQQSFGNAFGQGWQQAGCNSDILNAFQYQGQLGMGYFNPFMQQQQQLSGYSRGVYSNRQPVIKDLQPVIQLPVREAGNGGGIKVYRIVADLTAASESGDFVDFQPVDNGRLNSVPISYDPRLWTSSGSSTSLPKGSSGVSEKYLGFPYLKYNKDAKPTATYELQNWLGKGTTTVQSAAPAVAPAATKSETVGGTICSETLGDVECHGAAFGTYYNDQIGVRSGYCEAKAGAAPDSKGNPPCILSKSTK